MTKLEEIAWAISGQEGGELDPRWIRKAVAGLKEMRELNDETAERCGDTLLPKFHTTGIMTVRDLWEAMIDALLDEEPT